MNSDLKIILKIFLIVMALLSSGIFICIKLYKMSYLSAVELENHLESIFNKTKINGDFVSFDAIKEIVFFHPFENFNINEERFVALNSNTIYLFNMSERLPFNEIVTDIHNNKIKKLSPYKLLINIEKLYYFDRFYVEYQDKFGELYTNKYKLIFYSKLYLFFNRREKYTFAVDLLYKMINDFLSYNEVYLKGNIPNSIYHAMHIRFFIDRVEYITYYTDVDDNIKKMKTKNIKFNHVFISKTIFMKTIYYLLKNNL